MNLRSALLHPLPHGLRAGLLCLILAVPAARAENEELAAPALEPPVVNTSPLPRYGYDRLDYGMNIGLERTPGGRLWACWVAGGDNDRAFFVLATSDDDGATWSDPRAVVDPHDSGTAPTRRALVGNLWTDPQGRLRLFFDQSVKTFDGRAGVWSSICENPDDNQPRWSVPARIWHGSTLNKPTVLTNGDWLLPVSLWPGAFRTRPFGKAFDDLNELRMAHAFVSRDQGRNWNRLGGVRFASPRFDEHLFIERKDGSLWLTARTKSGTFESISTDGGRSWSEPRAASFNAGDARHFIRRLKSGNILLVKNDARIDACEGRMRLTAFVSDDDGRSWKGSLVLDERTSVSYPDGIEAPDGTLYLSYDRDRNRLGEILLARFTEADVLAGKFAGPKSVGKILVSRPSPAAVAARREREKQEAQKQPAPAAPGAGFHEILDAQSTPASGSK